LLFKPGVSQAGQHRLNALRESQDGFYLAEQDLKLRGPGDILGTRQSGEQSFKIADLGEDAHLMPKVVKRSENLMQASNGSAEHAYLNGLLNTWASADIEHLSV
jgi:ATP-dependent DNA helicase RecG